MHFVYHALGERYLKFVIFFGRTHSEETWVVMYLRQLSLYSVMISPLTDASPER